MRQRLGGESIADALMTQAGSLANNPYQFQIDYGQVDPMMSQDQFNTIQNNAAQEYTDKALALLNPEFQRQDQSKQLELMNRGIPVGGEGANEAGTTALADLAKQQNTARQQVAFEGLSRGGAEAQRQLANALQRREYQIGEQLRNFDQQNTARDVGIQNFAGLLGLNINQAPRGPGAQNQNAGIANAIQQGYASQMQNYQNQVNARNQNIGALTSLGSLALGGFGAAGGLGGGSAGFFAGPVGAMGPQVPGWGWQLGNALSCDESIKTDKKPIDKNGILESVKSLRVEEWKYNADANIDDQTHIGPYAQDWKEKTGLGDGTKISVIDAVGVILASIQALSAKVDGLEKRMGA